MESTFKKDEVWYDKITGEKIVIESFSPFLLYPIAIVGDKYFKVDEFHMKFSQDNILYKTLDLIKAEIAFLEEEFLEKKDSMSSKQFNFVNLKISYLKNQEEVMEAKIANPKLFA